MVETLYDRLYDRLYEAALRELIDDFYGDERRAWRYSKRKHDDTGAKRKASMLPYFVHPEGAAKLLKDEGASRVEVIASLCHDLVEDAGATLDDIGEKFGPVVASIVSEVTNDDVVLRRLGKERYMNEKLVGLSDEALTVKLADVVYNYNDSPSPGQKERLEKNLDYLVDHRRLDDIHLRLLDHIDYV